MIRELKKILEITGSGRKFLFLLLLRAPFEIASTIINAIFLQYAFDTVNQNDTTKLHTICIMYGIATLCLFLYNGTVWSIYAPFCARLEGRLRIRLFKKIASFSYTRVEAAPSGEWMTRLNADVEMPFSRGVALPHIVCSIFNISISAIILYRLNLSVFRWVILFVIPHILCSHFFIARAMPALSKESLKATAKNTDELNALITCSAAASLYDAKEYLMKRFERSSLDLFQANMRIRTRNSLAGGILPLFGLGGYLTLLINSSRWIAGGLLTFGDLTAAFQYRNSILAGSIMLMNCLISLKAGMAGVERLNETMSE